MTISRRLVPIVLIVAVILGIDAGVWLFSRLAGG
jgi:hypothetical protein